MGKRLPKILCIEGNENNRTVIRIFLQREFGITPFEAGDNKSAFGLLAKHRINLVITDMAQPEEPLTKISPLAGKKIVDHMAEECPTVNRIVVSIHKTDAVLVPGVPFLLKSSPTYHQELIRAVGEALGISPRSAQAAPAPVVR